MSDLEVQHGAEVASGLSQLRRVTNTFTAPSTTFEDIKRGNRSWWLPFLITALVGYTLFAAVSMKIGMQTVVDNQVRLDPKAQERMANATPEARATGAKIALYFTEGVFIASPLLALAIAAACSLVLWGTINFLFGGKAKFGSVFAVWMFAGLPGVIKVLLGIIVIFVTNTPESFNIKNFAPTNAGAFMNPMEANKVLYSLASSIDLVTIWSLILAGMGIAIVAGVKRTSGYIAVFGWWAIIVLIGVGVAAFTG